MAKQAQWIEKLVSGALGFELLETLRLKLSSTRNDRWEKLPLVFFGTFIATLEAVGPLKFKVKNVEIVVEGCICPGVECEIGDEYCAFYKRISTLLTAKLITQE